MPRALHTARLPDGSRLGGSAKSLCGLLWSYVRGQVKMREAGPHFVFHDSRRLAGLTDVGQRAVEGHLRDLRLAGLVVAGVHDGRWGFWLHTPEGCEDEGQPADSRQILPSGGPKATRPLGDRVRDRSEIADRSRQGSPIDRVEIADRFGASKEELNELKHEQLIAAAALSRDPGRQGPAAAAPGQVPLQVSARQLLAELAAAAPSGAVSPNDPRAVALLVQLLAVPEGLDGEDLVVALAERRQVVRQQLADFAAVCAEVPEQVRFWTPKMLSAVASAGKLSPWEAVAKTVETARSRRAAVAHQAAQEASERRERAERQAAAPQPRAPSEEALLDIMRTAGGRIGRECFDEVEARAEKARAEQSRAELERGAEPAQDLSRLSAAELGELRDRLEAEIAAAIARGTHEQAAELSRTRFACLRRLAEPRPFTSIANLVPPTFS